MDPEVEVLREAVKLMGEYIQELTKAGNAMRDALHDSVEWGDYYYAYAALAEWEQLLRKGMS